MRNTCCLVTLILAISCSGMSGSDPVSPDNTDLGRSLIQSAFGESNRNLWGLWEFHVPADRSGVDIVPVRMPGMHLNAVKLLEAWPSAKCIEISNLKFQDTNTLSLDLTLRYPWGYENLKFTSFDVRGIFMGDADYTFPASGRRIAMGDSVPRLLNPDGWTNLFNPTEFPPDQPGPPALRYIPPKNAPFTDLDSTLNPYIAFSRDVTRRMFLPETEQTRGLLIHLPDGPIELGYAIDCNWQLVDGEIYDPAEDFPPDANCLEAYEVSVWAGPGLSLDPGAWTWIYVTISDHQGFSTVSKVTAEVPDVFDGAVELDFLQSLGEEKCVYRVSVSNEKDAGLGDYPMLVRVEDTQQDQNLGKIDAWYLGHLPVRNGWVHTWGIDLSNDEAHDIVIDEDGNIYTSGYIASMTDIDPTPGVQPLSGFGFLSKFDWGGGYLWSQNITADWIWGSALMLDGKGSIYSAEDKLDKFDLDGNLIWELDWQFNYYQQILDLCFAEPDCIFITGRFDEILDFDPGDEQFELESAGETDAFLVKLNSSGEFEWAHSWGAEDHEYGLSLVSDSNGYIYVLGLYKSMILDLNPTDGVDEHEGPGTFLVKLDQDGNYIRGLSWFATGSYADMTIGPADEIYITGSFYHNVDFDPGPGMDVHVSNGLEDVYLSRFNTDGEFQWAKSWGNMHWDRGLSLAVDNDNNVLAGGTVYGYVDLDPGPGEDIITGPGYIIGFVSKFDPDGNYQWGRWWGISDDPATPWSIATDYLNNIYVVGEFLNFIDFDPGPGIDFRYACEPNQYYSNAYLLKLTPDGWWW